MAARARGAACGPGVPGDLRRTGRHRLPGLGRLRGGVPGQAVPVAVALAVLPASPGRPRGDRRPGPPPAKGAAAAAAAAPGHARPGRADPGQRAEAGQGPAHPQRPALRAAVGADDHRGLLGGRARLRAAPAGVQHPQLRRCAVVGHRHRHHGGLRRQVPGLRGWPRRRGRPHDHRHRPGRRAVRHDRELLRRPAGRGGHDRPAPQAGPHRGPPRPRGAGQPGRSS
jgi:hypothetical protein